MSRSTQTRLEGGIVPPIVTPLSAVDRLDIEGLERLLEHVIAGGVHGIFILGTTGEAASLSYRLRRELVTHTCRIVSGRLPVLVGITDSSLPEAAALAMHAAKAGAAALVTSAPFYYPIEQSELVEYVTRLIAELPLPLYLYNMPSMTKLQFDPETVSRLAQLEGIIGLKDSSGDLDYFKKIVNAAKDRPDWRVFMGPELLLSKALAMGAHGGVNGGAQLDPALLVNLYEACQSKNSARVAQLHARLEKLGRVYKVSSGAASPAVIKGVKCALSLMGICKDLTAAPLAPLNASEKRRVAALLEELDLLPVAAR